MKRRPAALTLAASLVAGVWPAGVTVAAVTLPSVTGCAAFGSQGYVRLRLYRTAETPRDAEVYIDEEYVGPLGMVIRRGVRFPVGEHRVTVQKEGYFPWDELVVADRDTLKLQVELVPIPD